MSSLLINSLVAIYSYNNKGVGVTSPQTNFCQDSNFSAESNKKFERPTCGEKYYQIFITGNDEAYLA